MFSRKYLCYLGLSASKSLCQVSCTLRLLFERTYHFDFFELAVLLRIFFQRFFFVLGFLPPLSFLLLKEERHQKRKSNYIESHDLFCSLPKRIRIF